MKGAENKRQPGKLKSSLLELNVFWKYVWFGTFVLYSFCLIDFMRWGFGDNTEKSRLTFAKVVLQAIETHRFLMNHFQKAFEGLFFNAKIFKLYIRHSDDIYLWVALLQYSSLLIN